MKKKIVATLIHLVFLLVFLELASRVFISTKYGMNFIAGRNYDTSNRLKWTERHITGSLDVSYGFDIYDSTKGWSIKPDLIDMPVFTGKVLNSNSKGIRGKNEYEYGKSPKKRILILGDSFTFGEEVSDDETYSYYLQQALPYSEVINFGVDGYGHDQMLIYLKEEGIKYKPDIIMLGFVNMDMARNISEFYSYSKPRFRVLGGKLKLENSPVLNPKEFIRKEPYRSKLVDLLNLIYQDYREKSGLSRREIEKVTTAILDEMVHVASQVGAIPVIAYLPVTREMVVCNKELPDEEYLYRYCISRGVYYFSLQPHFLVKAKSGITLKTEGHWGAKEHQIAAEAIKEYLESKNIIPKTS